MQIKVWLIHLIINYDLWYVLITFTYGVNILSKYLNNVFIITKIIEFMLSI